MTRQPRTKKRSSRSTVKKSRTAILALAALDENPWNPNVMEEEEYEELVAEVRRLGRVPKPVVVRQTGRRYEIIDGAHSFRAAKDVGLTEVNCEIIEADDFEAMTQTYKRNQHGTHNPLREGLMFQRMLAAKKLSKRELARRMQISEGKVRKSLDYVEAYEVRIRYAQAQHGEPLGEEVKAGVFEDISELSQRELQDYLKLPDIVRDRWIDGGKPRFVSKKLHDSNPAVEFGFLQALYRLVNNGLAELLPSGCKFAYSLRLFIEYDQWLQSRPKLKDAVSYAKAAAQHQLAPAFLDLLPCRYSGGTGEVVIPVEFWSEVLDDACSRFEEDDDRYAQLSRRLRNWLQRQGIDSADVSTLEAAALLQELESAPEALRAADFLSLDEKSELFRVVGREPSPHKLDALAEVLADMKQRRTCKRVGKQHELETRKPLTDMYRAALQRSAERAGDGVFAEPAKLRAIVESWARAQDDLAEVTLAGRPVADVLVERLSLLGNPEIALLAAAVVPEIGGAPRRRWFEAVRAETPAA